MAAQMNVGGALSSIMAGDISGVFHKLFDESPEENIREAVKDMREGRCNKPDGTLDLENPKGLPKILKELGKGGDSEVLMEVQQLAAELQAGGDPEEILQKIHELVNRKDADKTTNKISGGSAPAHRPSHSDIGY